MKVVGLLNELKAALACRYKSFQANGKERVPLNASRDEGTDRKLKSEKGVKRTCLATQLPLESWPQMMLSQKPTSCDSQHEENTTRVMQRH